MAAMLKARDTDFFKNVQTPRDRKTRRMVRTRRETTKDFKGKKFDDLTSVEKDDLLKALAIITGVVKE